MKTIFHAGLCLLLAVVMLGASNGSDFMDAQGSEATAGGSVQAATAAHGVNAFGLRLVADVAGHRKHENVFVSPLSVFFALAMTESGTRNQTQAAMRKVLAIPSAIGEDDLHHSASALLKSLEAQKGVQLSIANALWSDPRAPLAPGFITRCRAFYQADVTTLNLASPSAADKINAWVKQKTQGKIPSIVTPEAVRESLAVLTNAVYFKGGWEYTFEKNQTREGDFHLASSASTPGQDRIKKVPFMHRSSIPYAYHSGSGFEAAALPYANSDTVLYAILPAPGTTPEEALAKLSVDSLIRSPEGAELDLKLPKFTLDFSASLKDPLERMGMAPAFHQSTDFAPLGSPGFYIGDVLHKTRLEVDEEGTVAAAATAVMMLGSAVRPPSKKRTLVFDRPFALLLCDTRTGAILFAGVIYDPVS